jgi:hypothetical protein
MSDESNKGGWIHNPIPIAMVALMAAGVLVKVVPLESARPGEPDRTKSVLMGQQDVEARLWQDPLSAIEKEISAQSRADKKSPEVASVNIHKPEVLHNKIKTLTGPPKGKNEKNNVTILAVNLFGGSFDASAEWRRRARFAVLSALEFHGYRPENADALGYYVAKLNNDEGLTPVPLGVPYEWFSRWEKSERSNVLVLWLDEDKLLSPYKNLHSIFEELGGNLNVNVKLVGPAGSGTLLKLIKDASREKDLLKQTRILKGVGKLDVFSPTATISNCDLYTMAAIATSHVMQWNCFMSSAEISMTGLSGLPIVRTIATDDVLSAALLWELWHRGINRSRSWPPKGEAQLSGESTASQSAKCDDGLVLLREWDTQYAESLARNIQDGFADLCGAKLAPLKTFSYLRGLDGVVPGGDKANTDIQYKSGKQSSDASKDLRKQLEDAPPEHAEGRSQYDYLRRLTAEIERLDQDKEFAKSGVKAIGILGSDVYDKLLILMALRGSFPNKIFFTTDLDARYLHADQKDWSRNLVVVSSFGLTLHETLQKSTLPFRDTYQTGIYLAALAALEKEPILGDKYTADWTERMKRWLRPVAFEIGRDEAVHLASPSTDDLADWINGVNPQGTLRPSSIKPHCPKENWTECSEIQPVRHGDVGMKQWWIILIVIAAGVLLFILADRHLQQLFSSAFDIRAPSHAEAKSALVSVVVALLITALIVELIRRSLNQSLEQGIGEPFAWLEGVSVWPSLTISFISLVLMTALIWGLKFRLKRDANFISRYFGLDLPSNYKLGRTRISAIFIGPHIDLSRLGEDGKRIPDGSEKPETRIHVSTLWQNYLRATSWRETLGWVTLSTATALTLISVPFFLYGNPVFPHRGELVQDLYLLFGLLNALMLWAVIFWTSYEARACARLIDTLGKTSGHIWSEPPIEAVDAKLGVRTDDLAPYLDFRLITVLTQRIQLLIYLPFVSILFMIVGRSDLFDAMDFPPALLAVVVLSLAYAIYTEIVLRRAALSARGRVLREYEEKLFVLEGAGNDQVSPEIRNTALATDVINPANGLQTDLIRSPITAEQINLLMERIRNNREGAFAPVSQQPALQALLLPFGGLGGMQLIEYLMSFTISH